MYEIRSLLGAGGMAQVFEAQDQLLNRRVAVKAAITEPPLPSLLDEARALAAFRHPSLVTVYTAGKYRSVEYIIMERIYGVPLSEHLHQRAEQGVPLSIKEIARLLSQLAEGLSVVHWAGIAHRDVKPSNVMLTPNGRIVLMDFGLVLPEYEVSSTGLIAGSPHYMPPESITNDIKTGEGQLVDIYSLGVTAFELITGERPFAGENMVELWSAIHRGDRPDPRRLRDGVPDAFADLIMQMIDPVPHNRPQSAEAVMWTLRSLLEDEGNPTNVIQGRPPLDVLIVEDDDGIARVLRLHMRQLLGDDIHVRRAEDGVEALELIRERQPNVMLLDLHMPRMNGIEVCMHVRGERLADHMMIVAVSAAVQEHDIQLLHQLGMHHFVKKDGDIKQQLWDAVAPFTSGVTTSGTTDSPVVDRAGRPVAHAA